MSLAQSLVLNALLTHWFIDSSVQYSLEDPDKEVLDFGTLSEKVVMSMVFSVHNVNPIRVR